MKKKIIATIIVILLLVSTIPYWYSTFATNDTTLTELSSPNVFPSDLEGSMSVYSLITNTTFTCGDSSINTTYEWIKGSAPNAVGSIPDVPIWGYSGFTYNLYENKIYTYGGSIQVGSRTFGITETNPVDYATQTLTEAFDFTKVGIDDATYLSKNLAAYSPIQNKTYIFGGLNKDAGADRYNTVSWIHALHNHSVYPNNNSVLTSDNGGLTHLEDNGAYIPDLNIIVIAGGIDLTYPPGMTDIWLFNCSNETGFVRSSAVCANDQTADMASYYNTYDNLLYFAGGHTQGGGAYSDSVWVYSPYDDTVEDLEATQGLTIPDPNDDFSGAFNVTSLAGYLMWNTNSIGVQKYIDELTQSEPFTVPEIESIYQGMALADLDSFYNYEWTGTVATNHPRYNRSTITNSTPIIEWYKVTDDGKWDGVTQTNYNLTFASDKDFTSDVVTIDTSDYPSNYRIYGSLFRFQIPDSVDIGNGTRYVKVNGSSDSHWWVFQGEYEGAVNGETDPQIISISNDTSSPVNINDTTPLFNWSFSNHSNTLYYWLQIDNNNDFTSPEVNLTDINAINYPDEYEEKGRYVEFILPDGEALANDSYYVRMWAYFKEV